LPRGSILPAIIDVWDAHTFDPDLLDILEENADLIRTYFDTSNQIFLSYDLGRDPDRPTLRPENPRAAEFQALLEAMSQHMTARTIRTYHYTRLTDEEVTDLRTSGIHVSTPDTLRRRLDAIVASRSIARDIADHSTPKARSTAISLRRDPANSGWHRIPCRPMTAASYR
jgi:hypothetical protein